MKVCFTQEEVEEIVLAHVRVFFPEANKASISTYATDYCRVICEPPPEEPAEE